MFGDGQSFPGDPFGFSADVPQRASLRQLFGASPLARWFCVPQVRCRWRGVSLRESADSSAMPLLPAKHVPHCRDRYAQDPHAAAGLVWGAYLVTTQTPGMSALQFQRQLGLLARHGYDNLAAMGYGHESVVLDGDPEKTEKALPMIHLVFSSMKAWLLGTHHGVSAQHLPAYLNEFVFRFNRHFYPMTAFASVLGIGTRVAGPTYDDLYTGLWYHSAAPTNV